MIFQSALPTRATNLSDAYSLTLLRHFVCSRGFLLFHFVLSHFLVISNEFDSISNSTEEFKSDCSSDDDDTDANDSREAAYIFFF